MFLNTANVNIVMPYRARLGTHKTFGIFIDKSFQINIPVNLPLFPDMQDVDRYPDYTLSYAHSDFAPKIKNQLIPKVNFFNPNKVLWNKFDANDRYLPLMYLPYFSNCKGYGSAIPIFSVFEQQAGCDLVSLKDTREIKQFSFLTFENFWNVIAAIYED
jgi:hypothetical protein